MGLQQVGDPPAGLDLSKASSTSACIFELSATSSSRSSSTTSPRAPQSVDIAHA